MNWMNKRFLSTLIFIFSAIRLFGQHSLPVTEITAKSFPTNLNSENFNSVAQFDGKTVAFEGIIEQIRESKNNTPCYKLKIGKDYLWTVLMFRNKESKVGDVIRVVGYLNPVPDKKGNEEDYLDGKYMAVAFGLVDFKNNNFLFLGGAKMQRQEWMEGKIPSSK